MSPNPPLGIFLHTVGGLAAGSFYAPLKKVKGWAWESFWFVMGVAAWIVTPWAVAWATIPELLNVLAESPPRALLLCFVFGALWGIGGLSFGLAVRYLGMALGVSVALGACMVVGTMFPPIYNGLTGTEEHWQKLVDLFTTASGLFIVCGVGVCLAGIVICGLAGVRKESELTDEQKEDSGREFSLSTGFLVAIFAGVLSACFNFGYEAGGPIADIAELKIKTLADESMAYPHFKNYAGYILIMGGGFVSNAVWCMILNAQNRSFGDYFKGPAGRQTLNYFLSILGGVIWYGQFFFYGMGEVALGEEYKFSSWSIHMAFIIVFSNLWGIVFHEWRGTSMRTKMLVWAGILTLIASTVVIGYGNYLAG